MSASMQMRPPHDVATYAPDSLEVHYNNKRYALKNAIPEGKKPTAELVSSGNLIVRYNMSSRLKCVQECEEMITNENTKSINNKRHKHIPSPASPPSLGLPPPSLLQKSWEFVRDAEEYEAKRKLAPLTGSVLEAQLLISRVEAAQTIEASPVPLTRTYSVIEDLPSPLPGVSESDWADFRRLVFNDQ